MTIRIRLVVGLTGSLGGLKVLYATLYREFTVPSVPSGINIIVIDLNFNHKSNFACFMPHSTFLK